MSTVKIKAEPTVAAATAAVDVQVKLEPSLSTGDIKLEQHSSDIDTKVEPDSDVESDEGDIKSESEDDSDNDQNQFTITSKKRRQFICDYIGCGRSFKTTSSLNMHRHEHKPHMELSIHGKTYTLARQSLDDRWTCPVLDCKLTYKAIRGLCKHIRRCHGNTMRHQQKQQPLSQKTRKNLYFHDVDDFYVNGVRCDYHNTIGVFICYECRLVPECLLNHLQKKHGYDEKSIENSTLPDSAVNANADPSINQHTSNPLLASAIGNPYLQHHQNIVQGWLCITSDCGYCGHIVEGRSYHKKYKHQEEQLLTVPALVLRLLFGKSLTSYFLITRIDQANGAATAYNNRMNRHKLDYSHVGLNSQDENQDDVDQNETTDVSNQKKQWKCEYSYCRRLFNSWNQLFRHRREHSHEVEITVRGKSFTFTRRSSDDRWACPVPDCELTYKTINAACVHIQNSHGTLLKQKHANSEEDDDIQQQQQHTGKKARRIIHYLKVDDFYINGIRGGYHITTGVLICHECRLVPECLFTHMQQKHGYNGKSIDSSVLPESAKIAGSDANGNQHTGNPFLAAAIGRSYQQHPDIVQGWLCVMSDCGHCSYTKKARNKHQHIEHKGNQISTSPALVLRLLYGKTYSICFLITRLDTTTSDVNTPCNLVNQGNNECDDDDGDELVLSEYTD